MLPVVIEDLRRDFGPRTVVHGLNLTIAAGELFGLLGPNGSGKTTTLRMLTTLLPPTSGDARVGSHSIHQPETVRAHIGVVFQDPSLDTRLSALENLDFAASLYRPMWSRAERKEKAMEQLDRMGLGDRAGDLVRTYSWGMRRRLEIARSLMTDPDVLFLDEPTTGLDPQTRAALWKHLLALKEKSGLTILLATHDMQEAARCDRIGVLHEGVLQALDTPEQLCAKTGAPDLERAFLALTSEEVIDGTIDSDLVMKGKDSSLFRRG